MRNKIHVVRGVFIENVDDQRQCDESDNKQSDPKENCETCCFRCRDMKNYPNECFNLEEIYF